MASPSPEASSPYPEASVSTASFLSSSPVSGVHGQDFVALVSGGKDSVYSIRFALALGHRLRGVAYLRPPAAVIEADSFMYQSVGAELVADIARCMHVPLVVRTIDGKPIATDSVGYEATQGDEVEDLFALLQDVKTRFPAVTAVSAGAILSDYQRQRVENVCRRLQLQPFFFLWHRAQSPLLHEMAAWGLDAVLVKTAAWGLNAQHLGETIGALAKSFGKMEKEFGFHSCGEGGEYETVVVDCPLFEDALLIDRWRLVVHSPDAFAPVLLLQAQTWQRAAKRGRSSADSVGAQAQESVASENGFDGGSALEREERPRQRQNAFALPARAAAEAAKLAADKARREEKDGESTDSAEDDKGERGDRNSHAETFEGGAPGAKGSVLTETERWPLSRDSGRNGLPPCACRPGFASGSSCPACAFLEDLTALKFYLSAASPQRLARWSCRYTRAAAQLASLSSRHAAASSSARASLQGPCLPQSPPDGLRGEQRATRQPAPHPRNEAQGTIAVDAGERRPVRYRVTAERSGQRVLLHAVLVLGEDAKTAEPAVRNGATRHGDCTVSSLPRVRWSSQVGTSSFLEKSGNSACGSEASDGFLQEEQEGSGDPESGRGRRLRGVRKAKDTCAVEATAPADENAAARVLPSLIVGSLRDLLGAEPLGWDACRHEDTGKTLPERKATANPGKVLPVAHLLCVAFSPLLGNPSETYSCLSETPTGDSATLCPSLARQPGREGTRDELEELTGVRTCGTACVSTPSDPYPTSSPSSPSSAAGSFSGELLDARRLVEEVLLALQGSAGHPFPVTTLCVPAVPVSRGQETVPLLRLALELDEGARNDESERGQRLSPGAPSLLAGEGGETREGRFFFSPSFFLPEASRRFKEPFATRSLNLWVPPLTVLPTMPPPLRTADPSLGERRQREELEAGDCDAGRERHKARPQERETRTPGCSFSLASTLCQAATYTRHEHLWEVYRDTEMGDAGDETRNASTLCCESQRGPGRDGPQRPLAVSSPSTARHSSSTPSARRAPSVTGPTSPASPRVRCVASTSLPYSEILLGGVCGHLPHSGLLPLSSACSVPVGASESPDSPVAFDRDRTRAGEVAVRAETRHKAEWSKTSPDDATKDETKEELETGGVNADIDERLPSREGLDLALEVAAAARNLLHTARLAGAEPGKPQEAGDEGEDDSESDEELASVEQKRGSERQSGDWEHLTSPLPAPPPLVFAFSSLREATQVSRGLVESRRRASLSGRKNEGEEGERAREAAEPQTEAGPGQKRDKTTGSALARRSDLRSLASSAISSLLAGVRSQLEGLLDPQFSRSAERDEEQTTRQRHVRGGGEKEDGTHVSPETPACALCSSQDVNPLAAPASSGFVLSSLPSSSSPSCSPRLPSPSSLPSNVFCSRCVGATTLVVPAQVVSVQGGGHVSLWALGVRGAAREFSGAGEGTPAGLWRRDQLPRRQAGAGPFVSSRQRCTDSAQDCDEAATGDRGIVNAAKGERTKDRPREAWSLWVSGGRAGGRWTKTVEASTRSGAADDVESRADKSGEPPSETKAPGHWNVEVKFSALLEGGDDSPHCTRETETDARSSGYLGATWAAAVVTAARKVSRQSFCLDSQSSREASGDKGPSGDKEEENMATESERDTRRGKINGGETDEKDEGDRKETVGENVEEWLSVLMGGVVDAVLTLDRWTRRDRREDTDSVENQGQNKTFGKGRQEANPDSGECLSEGGSHAPNPLGDAGWCAYVLYVPPALSLSSPASWEGGCWEAAFRRLFSERMEKLRVKPRDSSSSPRETEQAACAADSEKRNAGSPQVSVALVFVPVLGLEQAEGCAPTAAQVVIVRDGGRLSCV
ncbi:conserved hypothetical protein [Neospora caninum Liverpool]|uniref:Diphthine--ammonia ligase n=1 Tax=Neospora caninum (strain Liverpool) TaxID=572307 RepID=F0VFC3_NEOCL|nr:conserved hypothetical protein [Neospora caninum Liverpool]CBZ52417.1 conserved hypothetical protein [Neospora caninum Liverpool]CEL66389.1 TPA: ATP-binding domain-containing protein 4 [Neospora caninum Liverpool]|eukprot:XP_003882449.1 conserved hypothetical protein [Neospora caninum Liverpool]